MGQLLRIIIILIGVWLVLAIIKRALASRRKSRADQASIPKMVACEHCGTHVPESEAIRDDGRHYCSEEHQKQART
jgi:uncharacterized protein